MRSIAGTLALKLSGCKIQSGIRTSSSPGTRCSSLELLSLSLLMPCSFKGPENEEANHKMGEKIFACYMSNKT
jgi:hypothetical protein